MVIDEAIEVLKIEAEGLQKLTERIDDNFVRLVDLVFSSNGRVIVSGIGKSGLVGRKIAATLNSTGTRSNFLHPVEAMHGDLGLVDANDILLALSYSGETDELNQMVPSIKEIGCAVITFTGNVGSSLAKHSDIVIDVSVEREACPLGLVPTASSTALLAMGDALAVTLINKRGFKPSDFKKYHPGGVLGQRLLSRVADIMLTGDAVPTVAVETTMDTALKMIDRMGLGATLVLDHDNRLKGIITDGDVRRSVVRESNIWQLPVEAVMTKNPKHIGPDSPAYDALMIMEKHEITVLPITQSDDVVCGIIHLHDILGKGDFRFDPNNIRR